MSYEPEASTVVASGAKLAVARWACCAFWVKTGAAARFGVVPSNRSRYRVEPDEYHPRWCGEGRNLVFGTPAKRALHWAFLNDQGEEDRSNKRARGFIVRHKQPERNNFEGGRQPHVLSRRVLLLTARAEEGDERWKRRDTRSPAHAHLSRRSTTNLF